MARRKATTAWRLIRDAKGQSMVEAALMLPLLLLITFAIIDFGVLFSVNLALESGVSQAARYGMTGRFEDGMTREESMLALMRTVTPTLDINDANVEFSHLSGGNWVAGVGGPGAIQRISVSYTHSVLVLTPFFSNGQITLRAESTMKNEERFE
jgi:Flp pilus assembly protein TadG